MPSSTPPTSSMVSRFFGILFSPFKRGFALLIKIVPAGKWRWVLYAVLGLFLIWGSWIAIQNYFGLNGPEYKTAKVEEGAIVATISASGTLNPVHSISVGTQVTGMIKELNVDFNDLVKKGQVIARIDPREYQARYDQAAANYELAKKNNDFNLKLVEKKFVSPQAMVQTEGAYKAALGALNLAKKSLDDTVIRAPVDGVVVKRTVEVGQTVAASLQAPEIFIIAKDLSDMQVETSIDESDVGRLVQGMDATFTVDAFPGKVFQSKVVQIRKAPITIQNVVTYTVLVSALNPDLKLLPGMTANVKIAVDKREKVIKIPNAALRFKMVSPDASKNGSPSGSTASTGSAGSAGSRGSGMKSGGAANWGGGKRRIWVLENDGVKKVAVQRTVRTGISDGNWTEIVADAEGQYGLKPDDEVIVGIQSPGAKSDGAPTTRAPRMF
jgi:HlyD family secretion protein